MLNIKDIIFLIVQGILMIVAVGIAVVVFILIFHAFIETFNVAWGFSEDLYLNPSEVLKEPIENDLMFIQGNSIIGKSENIIEVIKTEKDFDLLLNKIIECESGWNPNICNKEFGCESGMGLGMLIPSTVKYCEEKLNKKIDPFNPYDNIECSKYLLVKEGTQHWGTATSSWGSFKCWSRYL